VENLDKIETSEVSADETKVSYSDNDFVLSASDVSSSDVDWAAHLCRHYASVFSVRVPRVVAGGSAETNRNCLRRHSQPQFGAVAAI